MVLPMRSGVQKLSDTPVSELLEQWIGEQLVRGAAVRGPRPRIGIPAAGGTLRDGGWPVYGSDAPTVHAILEAGGLPCPIPALPLLEGYDPMQIKGDAHTFALVFDVFWPVLRSLDGLILCGGGDLSACLYGEPPHPQAETPDLWRDVWERYLVLLSWVLCLPTLGICRGMQIMNVALGGTLYQDLRTEWPKDRPGLLRHRAKGRVSSSNWVTHPVQLTHPDSRLARALKGRRLLDAVLSMHHQAVETLAPGLEVAASAPDGVIEAFEDISPARWWVATQFHPEWSTHLHWVMGLFTSFVDASRAYSAIPRDEIEPLRAEIQDWLRSLDGGLPARTLVPAAEAEVSPALTQPLVRRTSTLLRPAQEAVS